MESIGVQHTKCSHVLRIVYTRDDGLERRVGVLFKHLDIIPVWHELLEVLSLLVLKVDEDVPLELRFYAQRHERGARNLTVLLFGPLFTTAREGIDVPPVETLLSVHDRSVGRAILPEDFMFGFRPDSYLVHQFSHGLPSLAHQSSYRSLRDPLWSCRLFARIAIRCTLSLWWSLGFIPRQIQTEDAWSDTRIEGKLLVRLEPDKLFKIGLLLFLRVCFLLQPCWILLQQCVHGFRIARDNA